MLRVKRSVQALNQSNVDGMTRQMVVAEVECGKSASESFVKGGVTMNGKTYVSDNTGQTDSIAAANPDEIAMGSSDD